MPDTKAYPYATHLDIKFPALATVDVPALVKACTDRWYNQTLCRVNDSVVRLGVVQGEYHWHRHENDDEFFLCLKATSSLTSRTVQSTFNHKRALSYPEALSIALALRIELSFSWWKRLPSFPPAMPNKQSQWTD